MNPRELIESVTPPFAHRAAQKAWHRLAGRRQAGFSGDYPSWEAAAAASRGYDDAAILEKTRAALIEVRDGRAAYERDSVLFDSIEHSWPLATGLLRAAALNEGRLSVLDFGGSLGSTYFQNRSLLEGLRELRWGIVEQPAHVRVGRAEFEDDQLHFYHSVAEFAEKGAPDVIVLGSVLHYLPEPHAVLEELAALPCDHMIVDRTPFIDGPDDRLTVQQVDPWVYDATYPCWLFSRSRFQTRLEALGLTIVAEFDALDRIEGPVPVTYGGMLIDRDEGAPTA